MLERALDAAESLSILSERGRIVPELGNPRIREGLVGRYRPAHGSDNFNSAGFRGVDCAFGSFHKAIYSLRKVCSTATRAAWLWFAHL